MSRKLITYAVTLAMVFSVFCIPAIGYGESEPAAEQATAGSTAATPAQTTTTEPTVEKKAAPQVAKTTGVKAKAISSKTIRLTWKKVTGASGYTIYKYSSKKKQYRAIKTTKKRSFKSTKLRPDKTYRFRVKAYTTMDGKKYYGRYSKTVKAKTEKSDAQKIVAKAKSKIGSDYRYGASGPNGFDCSGFVYWVYKNAKVDSKKKIVRTSSSGLYSSLKKYKVGSSIKSIKKAKSGDILLFTRGGSFSHAAIYAGHGKLIHAANPRKGVCAQSVQQLHNSGTRVAAVIRVVK